MRGAPQGGFAAASFPIMAVISIAMRGRPPGGRHERWAQDARRRRRCQRRTVSGGTMTSAGRQPVPGQADPEETVHGAQPRPGSCSFLDGELLAQGEVLEGELAVAADEEGEQLEKAEHEGNHER